MGRSENWFLLLHGLFAFWLLVLGGVKCVWECWLFVVLVAWGRRKIVCFVDLCDVNVETVCMLYRTGDVLLYQVLRIRYHPMSTEYDEEMKTGNGTLNTICNNQEASLSQVAKIAH